MNISAHCTSSSCWNLCACHGLLLRTDAPRGTNKVFTRLHLSAKFDMSVFFLSDNGGSTKFSNNMKPKPVLSFSPHGKGRGPLSCVLSEIKRKEMSPLAEMHRNREITWFLLFHDAQRSCNPHCSTAKEEICSYCRPSLCFFHITLHS